MKPRFKILMFLLCLSITTNMQSANAQRTLTVFAASSLTETFTLIGKQFEKSHPDVSVRFSFSSSSTLATQLKAGAPADVFAAASLSDLTGSYSKFLSNYVVVAVPRDSKLTELSDLIKYKWIQCAQVVPCGAAAQRALNAEGLTFGDPVSYEPKVSSATAKLLQGEVDAAIIYNSDVVSNKDKLKKIDFSNRKAATTEYGIQLRNKTRIATEFIQLVLSKENSKLFLSKGFQVVK